MLVFRLLEKVPCSNWMCIDAFCTAMRWNEMRWVSFLLCDFSSMQLIWKIKRFYGALTSSLSIAGKRWLFARNYDIFNYILVRSIASFRFTWIECSMAYLHYILYNMYTYKYDCISLTHISLHFKLKITATILLDNYMRFECKIAWKFARQSCSYQCAKET